MLTYQPWMTNAIYWLGMAALLSLPWRESAWLACLPWVLAVEFVGALVWSAGFHRLFCHQSYEAPRWVHAVFGVLGVALMYGSPVNWAVVHTAHHRYADTDKDPHDLSLRTLLLRSYKKTPLSRWDLKRLLREGAGLHRFLHFRYVLVAATVWAAIFAASPTVFLNVFLPGVGLVHLAARLHTVTSHGLLFKHHRPLNLWWMEFILPVGGDWIHETHHDHPGRWDNRAKWWHPDPGALLIRLIKVR
jgi:fatty-acid desaturase